MLKPIILLVFILMQSAAYCASFKLKECKQEGDSCSLCKETSIEATPLVNVDKQIVQVNSRITSNGQVGSISLERCRVIDSNNWDCMEPAVYDPINIKRKDGSTVLAQSRSASGYKMINGQLLYQSSTWSWDILQNGIMKTEPGIVIGSSVCFVKN